MKDAIGVCKIMELYFLEQNMMLTHSLLNSVTQYHVFKIITIRNFQILKTRVLQVK